MMEHILMHDWYDNKSSDEHFVKEEDLDNCTTERILRNEFHDPLASSESEEEGTPHEINWDQIFKKKKPSTGKLFVAGLCRSPQHPRLSQLSPNQHKQFLKIISTEYPNVLKNLFLGKPTKQDIKEFEDAKQIYLKEQKLYQDWAKSLWLTDHCIRTLRPKPAVARVYEAECQMRAQRIQALPKHYNVAAHITLDSGLNNCDAVLKQDLIRVTLAEMPNVQIPDKIDKQLGIIKPCTVPEPCQKHPYQIVLPNEDALSVLPITEVHRGLATFALNNKTHCIASENALKCLTQWNRHWLLPVSVCDAIGPDGNRVKVLVLDSEFTIHKEAAHMRTYKAFRHLLEHALIPLSEKQRIWEAKQSRVLKKERKASLLSPKANVSAAPASQPSFQDVEVSSDDEDNHLYIDTGEAERESEISEPKFTDLGSPKAASGPSAISPKSGVSEPSTSFSPPPAKQKRLTTDVSPRRSTRISGQRAGSPARVPGHVPEGLVDVPGHVPEGLADVPGHVMKSPVRISRVPKKASEESPAVPKIGVYSCTCKGTPYEKPPRRSYKKWELSKEGTIEKLELIVHCPHKAKDKTGELLLEPIPEYQLDLGASEQKPDAVRSVALSLALRKNASVLNVRVDGSTGEVVTFEKLTSEAFATKHPGVIPQVISTLHNALGQLQALRPGHYMLQHEPNHGSNAMLMCPLSPGQKHTLELNFDPDELIRVDEAAIAKLPPTITTALLPYHKFRRLLPCAFTPYENMVSKKSKKPPQPPPKKQAPRKVPPHANKLPAEQQESEPQPKNPKKKRRKNNRW